MQPLTQQILTEKGNQLVARIQASIKTKPVGKFGAMNASGKTAASVHFEIDERSFRLYGAGHIFALEYGRRPTTGGGDGSLKSRIRVWIDDKGITPYPDKNGKAVSKDSLAFLIARKIHATGTELFRQGGNSGVLKDVINEATVKDLESALWYEFEQVVMSKLLEI